MTADFIKAALADIEIRSTLGILRRRSLISEFSSDFAQQRTSCVMDICFEYVLQCSVPAQLLRRFDQIMDLIRYVGHTLKGEDERECAAAALSSVAHQRDVLLLSLIEFWSSSGRSDMLTKLASLHYELPLSVRAYLEHCLTGQELIPYCSVRFADNDKIYYYLKGSLDVHTGDAVLVPAGDENHMEEAEVVAIEEYSYTMVPLPLEQTKKISKKMK